MRTGLPGGLTAHAMIMLSAHNCGIPASGVHQASGTAAESGFPGQVPNDLSLACPLICSDPPNQEQPLHAHCWVFDQWYSLQVL